MDDSDRFLNNIFSATAKINQIGDLLSRIYERQPG